MPILPHLDISNTVVFFDITLADRPIGRVKLELHAPVAAEFRGFCTGEARDGDRPVGFKNAEISGISGNRVFLPSPFVAVGAAGAAVKAAGVVAGMEGGFFVSLAPLEEKFPIIGQVYDDESMVVLRMVAHVPVEAGRPRLAAKIVQCGEY